MVWLVVVRKPDHSIPSNMVELDDGRLNVDPVNRRTLEEKFVVISKQSLGHIKRTLTEPQKNPFETDKGTLMKFQMNPDVTLKEHRWTLKLTLRNPDAWTDPALKSGRDSGRKYGVRSGLALKYRY
ncbi:hypothetical protein EVAR_24321_1 [Eumeta japonica]|uniref:Uncharacterized protein n=1 Tax=Eumeta variegata TaxID=151549 RepID=A0A4C1VLE5_EUMVA|nr:hypothetical protein EVAR_24321_1 [Eumeta japonica]